MHALVYFGPFGERKTSKARLCANSNIVVGFVSTLRPRKLQYLWGSKYSNLYRETQLASLLHWVRKEFKQPPILPHKNRNLQGLGPETSEECSPTNLPKLARSECICFVSAKTSRRHSKAKARRTHIFPQRGISCAPHTIVHKGRINFHIMSFEVVGFPYKN